MTEEHLGSVDSITRQEHPEVMTKPLPQILDEMEANIRAAAEAAKRAEEASKSARGAAGAATTASIEAGKRVEEARQAGESAAETAIRAAAKAEETMKTELLQRIEMLEKRLKNIEDTFPKQKTIILREITREEAMQEIEELFKKGYTLFYSDIAEKLHIDLELVVDICEELIKEGKVKIADAS